MESIFKFFYGYNTHFSIILFILEPFQDICLI